MNPTQSLYSISSSERDKSFAPRRLVFLGGFSRGGILLASAVLALLLLRDAWASTSSGTRRESTEAPVATLRLAASQQAAKTDHSEEVKRLLSAAKSKGETTLTLTGPEALVGANPQKYQVLFNRMYGTDIKINYTPGPGMGDMVRMISQEVAAGRKASTDVLVATEAHFAVLPKRNVLEPYDYSALSSQITKEMVAPEKIGVQVAGLIPAIAYNTEIIPPAKAPKRLEDVLDPKWKGKIAGASQYSIYARMAYHPQWSPEKMKTFLSKLSGNVAGLLNCGEHNRVVTGEFAMFVVNCGSYAVKSLQAKGAPIGYAIPEDAAVMFFWYMGIPQTSASPNLAKLYINTVMSVEGQKLYYEGYATDHFAIPGSRSAAEIGELKAKGIQILLFTPQLAIETVGLRELTQEVEKILREKPGGGK